MKIERSDVNGVAIVAIEGEVDYDTSPELLKVFDELVANKAKKVLIDLEKSLYVDSSCLATLIETQQRLKDYDGDMVLANVAPKVRGILEITKVDKLFKIFDSREEALGQI